MTEDSSRFSLAELSDRFGLEFRGDKDLEITGVGTLLGAGPDEISFLSNPAYRDQVKSTRAGAVILKPEDAPDCPVNCLLSDQPYISYARIAALFDPRAITVPGIHPSAVVDTTASIAEQVHIGANAVIGAGVSIGHGCSIGAGCVVGDGSRIGASSRLHANVTFSEGVRVGKRAIIHSGAVIGADGFGLAFADHHWEKIPQLGSVQIGNDCEIGANTTIDRGAIENTVLEDDVRVDNQVQIAHNVFIGAHTAIAGCAAIAGSSKIGRNCMLGGRASVLGHLEIADRVTIGANSEVYWDISEQGSVWNGSIPSMPLPIWQRNLVHMRQMDKIVKRIRELEKQHLEKPGGKPENNE